jgi:xanthine dehydrogenase accessory factor
LGAKGRLVREVTEALLALIESGSAGALATVVRVSGSVPQVPGARLLLRSDGSAVGTVGGGAIERRVLELLQGLLETPARDATARIVSCDLGKELGMCCGGSMDIFLEPIAARPRLWVLGAGHVAKPTAALAQSVGFEVVVVDERDDWNTEARFPGCRRELTDAVSCLRRERASSRDWLLIVTPDHRADEEALRFALTLDVSYIGLVGSRRKVYRLLQRVAARSGSLDLRRVYAPVGLDLGAVTPEEIAVSIVAELTALRHAVKVTGHLRAVEDGRLQQLLREDAGNAASSLDARMDDGRGLEASPSRRTSP